MTTTKKAAKKPTAKTVKLAAKADPKAVAKTPAKGRVKLTPENTKGMSDLDRMGELGPLSDAIGAAAAKKRGKMTPPPAPSTAKLIVEEEAKEQERRAKNKDGAKDADAPHIECRLFVGGIGYPVDASSLERTLGAGRWQRESLVDAWPDAAWVGLLTHLDLPADPLDRAAASIPVKRLVQRLWYEAVAGGVPDERKAAFAERDAEAASGYKPDFEKAEAAKETRAKAGARMSAARGGPTAYEPVDKLKGAKDAGGQAGILFAAFKAANFAPMTTEAAAAGMTASGLKTTTKPERIAAFYLCQWLKKGWLARKETSNA